MPFTAGKNPTEGGNFIKTKELPQLARSGLFLVQIASAIYYEGEGKNGNLYKQCRLDCGVMYNGQAVKACSFSIFLPSHDMEALCYFLNLRDADGNLSLPDPTHREGTSSNGKAYTMDTFPCLQNQLINVCLEFKGTAVSSTGSQYSTFNLKGFCDVNGCTAVEAYQNKPAETLKGFIETCRLPPNAGNQYPSPYGGNQAQATAQASAYGQPISPYPNGGFPSPSGVNQGYGQAHPATQANASGAPFSPDDIPF